MARWACFFEPSLSRESTGNVPSVPEFLSPSFSEFLSPSFPEFLVSGCYLTSNSLGYFSALTILARSSSSGFLLRASRYQ
jgi:hypothetical protein